MRLIDADALKTIRSILSADYNSIETIQYWIDNAPTIDAVPATIDGALGYLHKVGWMQEHDRIITKNITPFNHGHWIKHEGRNGAKDSIECSACGVWIDDMPRKTFCPNCGSIMYRYGGNDE